jgi:hypothetical protein
MTALAESLKSVLGDQLATKLETRNQPFIYYSLWPQGDDRRRQGINPRTGKPFNDAHISGTGRMPCTMLRQLLAEAEAKGHEDIQFYIDLWVNESGQGAPITGKSTKLVPDDKRFIPESTNDDVGYDDTQTF